MLVLPQLAPKSLAIARTSSTGLLLLGPMRAFGVATRPVVDLFNWLGNLVLRPFGIPPASEVERDVHRSKWLATCATNSSRTSLNWSAPRTA